MSAPLHILEIQSGKYKGRQVKLNAPEMLVGRGDEARVKIASVEVSRQHCILIPQERGVLIRDLESRNGTFVDGRPISGEKLLLPGSQLTIGPLTFRLLGEETPPAPRTGPVNVLGKTGADQKLSDDDIADWLSDEFPSAPATHDTTIVKGRDASAPPATPVAPPREAAPEIPRRKEFKSVEDEARDIIRRYYEETGRQPPSA